MSQPIIVQIPEDEAENETSYDWVWPLALLIVIVGLIISLNFLDPRFLAPLFTLFTGLGG